MYIGTRHDLRGHLDEMSGPTGWATTTAAHQAALDRLSSRLWEMAHAQDDCPRTGDD